MKRIALLMLSVALIGCHKKPDDPPAVAQSVTQPPPPPSNPPPVSNCQGATVHWVMPVDLINDNSTKAFTVPNFDVGCGDTVRVYIKRDFTQSWSELFTVNQGASYFEISGQTITVHNATGIVVEVEIEAVLH